MPEADGHEVVRVVGIEVGDIAYVVGAASGMDGLPRPVRSPKMALAGVDRFWKIGGLLSDIPLRRTSSTTGANGRTSPSLASRSSVSLPFAGGVSFGPGVPTAVSGARPEPKSYKEVEALKVGLRSDDLDRLLDLLKAGTLKSILSRVPDFIEVREGLWLAATHVEKTPTGLRFAERIPLSKIPVTRFAKGMQTTPIGSDLVVFAGDTTSIEATTLDLRSEDEIVAACDAALARVSSVLADDGGAASISNARQVISRYAAASMTPDENADMQATLELLDRRERMIDILPKVILASPTLAASLDAAVEREREGRLRLLDEEMAKRRHEIEAAQEEAVASRHEIEAAIEEARRRLELLGERERAYRDGMAEIERMLDTRLREGLRQLADEARSTRGTSSDDLAALRAEMRAALDADTLYESLREHLEPVVAAPPSYEAVDPDGAETMPLGEPIDKQARTNSMADLATRFDVDFDALTIAVAGARIGRLPVFVGPAGGILAVELASAILPGHAFRLFCDPTMVSVRDLLVAPGSVDGESVLQAARTFALAAPDALVPVVLIGLTRSPCEFWLDALLDRRSEFGLPPNLLVLASADEDGIRTPMPFSRLVRVLPVRATKFSLPGVRPAKDGTFWPSGVEAAPSFSAQVIVAMSNPVALGPSQMSMASEIASLAASSMETTPERLATALLSWFSWIDAMAKRGEHADLASFRKFED